MPTRWKIPGFQSSKTLLVVWTVIPGPRLLRAWRHPTPRVVQHVFGHLTGRCTCNRPCRHLFWFWKRHELVPMHSGRNNRCSWADGSFLGDEMTPKLCLLITETNRRDVDTSMFVLIAETWRVSSFRVRETILVTVERFFRLWGTK